MRILDTLGDPHAGEKTFSFLTTTTTLTLTRQQPQQQQTSNAERELLFFQLFPTFSATFPNIFRHKKTLNLQIGTPYYRIRTTKRAHNENNNHYNAPLAGPQLVFFFLLGFSGQKTPKTANYNFPTLQLYRTCPNYPQPSKLQLDTKSETRDLVTRKKTPILPLTSNLIPTRTLPPLPPTSVFVWSGV